MQPLTFFRVQLLYIVKENEGKPDRKPYPLPYGLRNPYRNLKSENSVDYAQKPQQNCTFMNSASGLFTVQQTFCRVLYGMYSVMVILPRLKCTQIETRLHRHNLPPYIGYPLIHGCRKGWWEGPGIFFYIHSL